MLKAQFLKFDAGPADGLPISVKQVHAAHKSIDVLVLNFLSHKGQHVHGPRVTAAQQYDGSLLGSHDQPLTLWHGIRRRFTIGLLQQYPAWVILFRVNARYRPGGPDAWRDLSRLVDLVKNEAQGLQLSALFLHEIDGGCAKDFDTHGAGWMTHVDNPRNEKSFADVDVELVGLAAGADFRHHAGKPSRVIKMKMAEHNVTHAAQIDL